MTLNEYEQFEAKQISKWYKNTYCGQCDDIIYQKRYEELKSKYNNLPSMNKKNER